MSQQSTSSTAEVTESIEPSFMGGEAPQESKGFRQKLSNIRQEFVDFINRGSVVDLAIGVAVGGAFNTVVNSLVNDIVMPIVGLIAGGVDFNNLAIRIPNFFGADDAATIAYGRFLQACLQFLIIAWVFFLIVKALNSLHRKREKELAKINQAVEKTEAKLGEKFTKAKEAVIDSHADNAKAAKTHAETKVKTSAANTKTSTKPHSKSTKK